MNKFLLDIPDRIETERLILRTYRAGDGPMYYAAGMRNRDHLTEFESDNVLMDLKSEEDAEATVRELAADWQARTCFFIGTFQKATEEWTGQIYVGPTNWDPPEFAIEFVADVNCEGKGFITEAVNGILGLLFEDVGAHRVKSECSENNPRSWRLLERCGFRREGHLLENRKYADGSFHGDYLYGLLRREYSAR